MQFNIEENSMCHIVSTSCFVWYMNDLIPCECGVALGSDAFCVLEIPSCVCAIPVFSPLK